MTDILTIDTTPSSTVIMETLSGTTQLADALRGAHALIISDSNVAELYAETVRNAVLTARPDIHVGVHAIQAGESSKNLEQLNGILDALATLRATRDATVIALGGGVVGDIAGLAAALWMRGIDCIQMPTTLLAMVDSSVGGKTAIDMPQGKNLIGAFHQPVQVRIDVDTLTTLPDREFNAGMAEVIKYGAIFSGNFLSWLDENADDIRNRDHATLTTMVKHCIRFKSDVVVRDPTERGERALLNFGHTFGHAIESVLGYDQRINHGEAVAIGMVAAARLSEIVLDAQPHHREKLADLLGRFGLGTGWPSQVTAEQAIEAMQLDKKAVGGELRFVLWHGAGSAVVVKGVPERAVKEALISQFS